MIIHNLEQGSLDWLRFKAGKVSGTSLKSAVGTPKVRDTLINRLIAERMTETVNDELNTEAVLRGKELEPIALKAIIKEVQVPFETIGMIAPDDLEDFAVSPDAICYNKLGVIEGGVEIKCPNSKKHVEYIRANEIPKEYRHQVLAPFLCDDSVNWWYFVSFDDRNYERPLFIKIICRNEIEEELKAMRLGLGIFLAQLEHEYMEITF